ncbi:MAG: C40 family peptidase [Acidobacteriota bacterium]|nr:C40 family peptidase [Acidobacteriota bacterium]MDE3044050.1 C40 family peptidase [Acidobacteriota bacterium]MDE3107697.1 C40 family peptidase [Acidobacteriota bacterium]
MTDVRRFAPPTPRSVQEFALRGALLGLTVVAVFLSTVIGPSRPAGASSLANERRSANILLDQINRTNAQVERLGQKYDEAQIKLHRINNVIANTKAMVASIQGKVDARNVELRKDVILAYVNNGATTGSNPLFTTNASKAGTTNVYSQLAAGNISATIADLKNSRIQLTHERGVLRAEDANARAVTIDAARSYHKARLLQASLNHSLAQVKGQIAIFISEAQAAANAQSATALAGARPVAGFAAPPPDSRANIAIRAALSFIGVPYQWGGASRSGVDCSGLIMLAYEAAGISLSHYSGAQYQETMRVPLVDIQPGDLLFYGYNGDEHVAMYVGHGDMIEAEMTGTRVHVVPVRLGYGFVGLGRPRG